MPLLLLKQFFGSLSRINISRPERLRVDPLPRVRHERLRLLELQDGEPNLLLLSNVPVSLLVEVGEAHVVAVDFADFGAIGFDLTADPVLSLHPVLAWLVEAFKLILFVCERYFPRQLMAHVAHENIKDVVSCVVESYPLSVFENDFLVALRYEVCRLHSHLDAMLRPAVEHVVFVGSLNEEVGNGWMMTSLLHVDHRAILSKSLVGLTENRIQRLLENFLLVEERQIVGHEELHSLNGILDGRSLVEVDDHGALQSGHQFQSRDRRHALDREADLGQICLATEQFFTDHFNDFSCSAAESFQEHRVRAGKATVVACIWAPMMVCECRNLKLGGNLTEFLRSGHSL